MNRSWGNIAEDPEDPVFENWKVPDISNPENIEQHFPVIVRFDKDNEYSITWHLANVQAWKSTRPETWDEFQDYEDYVQARLKYALAVHSDNYKMIPIQHPDELFRFELKRASGPKHTKTRKAIKSPNSKKSPKSPKKSPANKTRKHIPTLFLLNDIKEYFPVVWHKDPRNPKLLGLQLHKMKVQSLAKEAGKPRKEFEETLIADLLHALEASEQTGAWKVLPSRSRDYVCMLQLRK
jgi:hypothetical protein